MKFVWGRCTLPKSDDDFTAKFKIDSYDVSNGSVDGALPSKFHVKTDQSYSFPVHYGNMYIFAKTLNIFQIKHLHYKVYS